MRLRAIAIAIAFCICLPAIAEERYVSISLRNPQDVEFHETAKLYLVNLRKVFQKAWFASAPHKFSREVEFLINLDGTLFGAKVRAKSKYSPDDQEALAIVNSSFPQSPLPKGVRRFFHIIAKFQPCTYADANDTDDNSLIEGLGEVAAGTGNALAKGTGGILKTLANVPRVIIPRPTYGYSYWQWPVQPVPMTPYMQPSVQPRLGRSYVPTTQLYRPSRLRYGTYTRRPVIQAPTPAIRQDPAMVAMNQTYTMLNQADQLVKHKQRSQAIQILSQAAQLTTNPNSSAVHGKLGQLLSEDGRHEEALDEYRIAYQLKPGSAQASLGIAACYQSMGNLDGATNALEGFLVDHPNDQHSLAVRRQLEGLRKADREWQSSDPTASDYLDSSIAKGLKRWEPQKFPLKVFIADGRGARGYHSEYRNYVTDSLSEWSSAASESGLAWVEHSDRDTADLTLDWSSDRNTNNSTEGGLTEYSMTKRQNSSVANIQKIKITIWTVELGGRAEPNTAKIRTVVLHEIGHALGLNHSPNAHDVMFFSVTTKPNEQLSERDRNTIRQLYLCNPDKQSQSRLQQATD